MKKPDIYIVYTAAVLLLFFLSSCTVREEAGREIRPGQAFTAGERQARRGKKRTRSQDVIRSRRIRLEGRPEFRSEKIIPSRLEYFQGNPQLMR